MKIKMIGVLVVMLLIITTFPNISSSYIQKTSSGNIQEFVSGEFIVKFKEGFDISDSNLVELNEKHRVSSMRKIVKNSDKSIIDNIYLLKTSDYSDVLSIIQDYSLKAFVEYAEPNYLLDFIVIPNDANFSNQWYLHNIGQSGGKNDADIDGPEAWDIKTGSSEITIAIIDSGVDYTHPDLADNIWINIDEIIDNGIDDDENGYIDDNIGWDFIGESVTNPQPDNDPIDDLGHGTHCAGLASAVSNNNDGIASVCWNCKIMALRVGNEIGIVSLEAAIEAIAYAIDNEADVISMSFGTYSYSQVMKDAMDYAFENGVTLVGGAGNLPLASKFYPAAFDNVIAVAATNKNDERAFFSAYGEWIDVAAPGREIYSTLPSYHVILNDIGLKMYYDYLDGTSMSCPIVAGLAGLLLSYDPNLTPDEVKSYIVDSTDWIKTDKILGNGRINAHKALILLSGISTSPGKPSPPSGQTNGQTGVEYIYTVTTTDPDGDSLEYLFSWGDGTYSDWVGPFPSGETGSAAHAWLRNGAYSIKVKARDSYGLESEWSDPLNVVMPRSKQVIKTQLLHILEVFMNQFSFLEKLLNL